MLSSLCVGHCSPLCQIYYSAGLCTDFGFPLWLYRLEIADA
jgi:hypothetical protein